jgi:hypothetical protein
MGVGNGGSNREHCGGEAVDRRLVAASEKADFPLWTFLGDWQTDLSGAKPPAARRAVCEDRRQTRPHIPPDSSSAPLSLLSTSYQQFQWRQVGAFSTCKFMAEVHFYMQVYGRGAYTKDLWNQRMDETSLDLYFRGFVRETHAVAILYFDCDQAAFLNATSLTSYGHSHIISPRVSQLIRSRLADGQRPRWIVSKGANEISIRISHGTGSRKDSVAAVIRQSNGDAGLWWNEIRRKLESCTPRRKRNRSRFLRHLRSGAGAGCRITCYGYWDGSAW